MTHQLFLPPEQGRGRNRTLKKLIDAVLWVTVWTVIIAGMVTVMGGTAKASEEYPELGLCAEFVEVFEDMTGLVTLEQKVSLSIMKELTTKYSVRHLVASPLTITT